MQLPESRFNKYRSRLDGLQNYCKDCQNQYRIRWKQDLSNAQKLEIYNERKRANRKLPRYELSEKNKLNEQFIFVRRPDGGFARKVWDEMKSWQGVFGYCPSTRELGNLCRMTRTEVRRIINAMTKNYNLIPYGFLKEFDAKCECGKDLNLWKLLKKAFLTEGK